MASREQVASGPDATAREHDELCDRVRELARRRLPRRRTDARGRDLDVRNAFRVLGEFGLLGLAIAEEHGGVGAGVQAAVRAMEALGHAGIDGGLAFSLGAHVWAVQMPLLEHGTDAQRRDYLRPLCAGSAIGAIALSEPEAGSDLFAMRTRAEDRGDHYVLDGRKAWCTNAPIADLVIVLAATGGTGAFRRCSAFVVEAGTPGLSIERTTEKLGLEGSPMADVVLDGCAVPRTALLGRWGRGGEVFHDALTWERGALAAPFVGAMQRQLDDCVSYAGERRQFGESIGKNQAISHRLAEMRLRLETARLLLHRFAEVAARGEDASLESALVKVHVSESYVQSSLDAIQLHGANGYAAELGVADDLRDALGLRIASGTNEMQRNAIARHLGL